jgi:hypothetical protein
MVITATMRLASSMIRSLALASCLIALGACKQGLGERCQVSSDCEDGLTCNQGTHTCSSAGSGVDGGGIPPIDAMGNVPDGAPDAAQDAAIDAAADAAIDATPDAT